MFFTEKNRKKNLIVFFLALPLFCGVVFLLHPDMAYADLLGHSLAKDTGVDPIDAVTNVAGDALAYPFKLMLYGVFVLFGWMASLAITIFEWVIKPENISGATGVLNQPVVYEMWKFIRDFFNLFFILVLLYVAFKIVFQIEHDFKKTLLSIVLAALFINFSFPVTRVLIDVTNVPMYFFANQMAAKEGGGTTVFNQVMTASKLEKILLPAGVGSFSTDFSRIFVAVIFLFLFAVTLLVLAVMFIVRLVALVILVIFSPVGFAASIVPGLEQYSKMWWENFWKYAFFGPAAMLMILVSIRFFSALGDEKSGIFKSLTTVASGTVASEPTFFASMALFSVPIIMLWMAMGLAQTFSIAGASSVVGQGKKFSAWAGKAPFRAGWAGTKWAGRKAESKLAKGKFTKYLSPTVIKEAWKARSEEQHHEDKLPIEMAKGQMHDDMNKALNYVRSKSKIVKSLTHEGSNHNEFLEENKQKAHYEAEIKEQSGGEINENQARRALREGIDEHNRVKVLAASTLLSRINGLDNVSGDHAIRLGTGTIDPTTGLVDISESYDATMAKILRDLGVSEESIKKHIHNMGENAKSKGDNTFADLYEPDISTGEWQATGDNPALAPPARAAARATARAKVASGNFNKGKAQTRHDIMHARTLFKQVITNPVTGDREYADMNETGSNITKAYTSDDVGSAGRENNIVTQAQVDAFVRATNPATRANYPTFIDAYNSNEHFRQIIAQKVYGKSGTVAAPGVAVGPNEVPFNI